MPFSDGAVRKRLKMSERNSQLPISVWSRKTWNASPVARLRTPRIGPIGCGGGSPSAVPGGVCGFGSPGCGIGSPVPGSMTGPPCGVPSRITIQSALPVIGSSHRRRIERGSTLTSSSSCTGRRPKRRWKTRIASAYCRPREISSSSLSRLIMPLHSGRAMATTMFMTVMIITTMTRL